jgi:hypothetical protein
MPKHLVIIPMNETGIPISEKRPATATDFGVLFGHMDLASSSTVFICSFAVRPFKRVRDEMRWALNRGRRRAATENRFTEMYR